MVSPVPVTVPGEAMVRTALFAFAERGREVVVPLPMDVAVVVAVFEIENSDDWRNNRASTVTSTLRFLVITVVEFGIIRRKAFAFAFLVVLLLLLLLF